MRLCITATRNLRFTEPINTGQATVTGTGDMVTTILIGTVSMTRGGDGTGTDTVQRTNWKSVRITFRCVPDVGFERRIEPRTDLWGY